MIIVYDDLDAFKIRSYPLLCGAFPTLISILLMFFTPAAHPFAASLLLCGLVLLGIAFTLLLSRLLSHTILKGVPSGFTLELPPYRKPDIVKVLVRSLLDRTLFVLGRAARIAIPAGAMIWLLANIPYQDSSLLLTMAHWLDAPAAYMGLDGMILLAFLLGFPANEIVLPILLMGYLANTTMISIDDMQVMKQIFLDNGWTWLCALCTLLFMLFHFPCATALQSVYHETQSKLWTLTACMLPTLCGVMTCIIVHAIGSMFL